MNNKEILEKLEYNRLHKFDGKVIESAFFYDLPDHVIDKINSIPENKHRIFKKYHFNVIGETIENNEIVVPYDEEGFYIFEVMHYYNGVVGLKYTGSAK